MAWVRPGQGLGPGSPSTTPTNARPPAGAASGWQAGTAGFAALHSVLRTHTAACTLAVHCDSIPRTRYQRRARESLLPAGRVPARACRRRRLRPPHRAKSGAVQAQARVEPSALVREASPPSPPQHDRTPHIDRVHADAAWRTAPECAVVCSQSVSLSVCPWPARVSSRRPRHARCSRACWVSPGPQRRLRVRKSAMGTAIEGCKKHKRATTTTTTRARIAPTRSLCPSSPSPADAH